MPKFLCISLNLSQNYRKRHPEKCKYILCLCGIMNGGNFYSFLIQTSQLDYRPNLNSNSDLMSIKFQKDRVLMMKIINYFV